MAQVSECPKQGANALSVRSRRRLKRIFTADDLLHLPDAPDGRCYELVGGGCTNCRHLVCDMGM